MIKNLVLWIAIVSITIFSWEHIAITNDLALRPTYFIDTITSISQELWRLTGIIFAYLGSYYEYLRIDKLGLTVLSFVYSFVNLITSVEYFWHGFMSVASLYDYPAAIATCAVLIIILGLSMFERVKVLVKKTFSHCLFCY